MPGAQREDLATMPIPTASKWECMDEACRKNVHVSRALRILSTRVFLTRDGFGVGVPNWECLTCLIGSASLPAPLALKQLECRHGGHG